MWEGPSHVVTRFLHGIVRPPGFAYFGHPFRGRCAARAVDADADAEQAVKDVAPVLVELDGFRSAVSALSSLPYRLRGAP